MDHWHSYNWSGHIAFGAARFHRPTTVAGVQEIVRSAQLVRVIGSRHCFNDIADTTGDMLWLGDLEKTVVIDRESCTATVSAGLTYEELCPLLERAGFALPNLASLKHITVVGACMTGTHGSGDKLGNLATAVSKLEMVTANGDLLKLSRDKEGDDFLGAVVALGALGVVAKLTLDLVPTYGMQQDNYERMPFREIFAHFDEITSAGYSVSLFPTWQHDWCDTVWVKQRLNGQQLVSPPINFHGAVLASDNPSGTPPGDRSLTPFGLPGPWHERLPHYAFHDARQVGNELQSEYFFPREHAVGAMRAVASLRIQLAPILGLSEVRTMAADQLWLSPAYGQETVGIHFNWLKQWEGIEPFLPVLESALAPFRPRPHLGKLFAMPPAQLAAVYPRMKDFQALVRRFDPAGKFSNRFVRKYVMGESAA